MTGVRLTAHSEPMSAEIVRTILLDAGLPPLAIRQSGTISIAGTDQCYFVQVPEQELAAAVEVVEASVYAKYLW